MHQAPLNTALSFRELNENDIHTVLAIESACYGFPWSEKIFLECIHSSYQCTAILVQDELIGYSIVSHVLDEAHLLNICLSPQWQGKKLARQTMLWLMNGLSELSIDRIFLEVRPSNLPALALYTKLGFESIGLRKAYYLAQEGREDAITMMKML